MGGRREIHTYLLWLAFTHKSCIPTHIIHIARIHVSQGQRQAKEDDGIAHMSKRIQQTILAGIEIPVILMPTKVGR